MILLSQVAMRRQMSAEEAKKTKIPCTILANSTRHYHYFMAFVIAILGYFESTRMALIVGLVWVAILTSVGYYIGIKPRITQK